MTSKSTATKPSSMTGFARVTSVLGLRTFEFMIRSVNHRFLDISLKIPRELSDLENKFRSILQARLQRGRVDVQVNIRTEEGARVPSKIDKTKIESAVKEFIEISRTLGVSEPDPSALITQLFLKEHQVERSSVEEAYTDADSEVLMANFERAVASLQEERMKEGEGLIQDVRTSLSELSENIESIASHSESAPARFKEKLLAKLKAAQAELSLDPARFAAECALQAERLDIAEEISRARSHIKACLPLLEQANQGKRLEFFAQELHREFTTLSGKSQDAQIQALSVSSRVQVEKIREQAQNLE